MVKTFTCQVYKLFHLILLGITKVLLLVICTYFNHQRNTDWDAAAMLLEGVYETMVRCPYIMQWAQVKTLLNTVQVSFQYRAIRTDQNSRKLKNLTHVLN